MAARSFFQRLGAISMAERVQVFETELCGWAGKVAGLSPGSVTADFRIRDFRPAWFAGGHFFRALEAFLTNELGFSGFYEAELIGRSDLRSLAAYLAGEVDLPPRPAAGEDYGNPDDFSDWGDTKPTPYEGRARIEKPTVFIVGTPRSGTTLLRTMLAGHDRIYAPPELHLLPYDTLGERRRAFDALGSGWRRHGFCQAVAHQLQMTENQAYHYVDMLEARDLPTPRAYGLLHSYGPDGILVDKSPGNWRHPVLAGRSEQMFVEPKYLYLTRHPAAVVESFVRMRFRRLNKQEKALNPWLDAERIWTSWNRVALNLLSRVPPARQHRVRYEELVKHPEKVMTAVARFLGLDYQRAMANAYDSSVDRNISALGDPGLSRREALDPGLAEAWRKLPPYDFRPPTKETATRLGYDV